MALNAENVRLARTGEFFYAWQEDVQDWVPEVTRVGEEVTVSTLPEDFKSLGYFSSDGWSKGGDVTTSNRTAWQNADVVRSLTTEVSETITLNPIETTRAVLELVRNATMDANGVITANLGNPKRVSIFGNIVDGSKVHHVWLPSAEITSREAESYSNETETAYTHTLTAYKRVIDGEEYGPIWEAYPYLAS